MKESKNAEQERSPFKKDHYMIHMLKKDRVDVLTDRDRAMLERISNHKDGDDDLTHEEIKDIEAFYKSKDRKKLSMEEFLEELCRV